MQWVWTSEDKFSCHSLLFETGSPSSLDLAKQAGMGVRQASGICLFPSPQNWAYTHTPHLLCSCRLFVFKHQFRELNSDQVKALRCFLFSFLSN